MAPDQDWAVTAQADEWAVDFSKAEEVPVGVLLLTITKYTKGSSRNGNRKVDVQLKVAGGEDDKYNGRMIFGGVTLTEASMWRAKQFAKAFLGEVPAGSFSFANEQNFLGQSAWCLVVVEQGEGEYAGSTRARVDKWGVKAPQG